MTDFRNRIVETRIIKAAELSANPLNWRRHPQSQASAIRGLLSEVGIVAPLIAYHSQRANGALTLIDGHMRQETGGAWPVTVLDVSDEEADLILASFDPITGLAELDSAALAELLGRVEMTPVENDGVRDLLAQMNAENKLTSLQDAGNGENNARSLATKGNIKAVISLDQVATFEQAIRATGLRNRGEAVLRICEYYLQNGEKRQLDDLFESLA